MRIDWSKITLAQAVVVVALLATMVALVKLGQVDGRTVVAIIGAWLSPSLLPLSPATPTPAPPAGEVAK